MWTLCSKLIFMKTRIILFSRHQQYPIICHDLYHTENTWNAVWSSLVRFWGLHLGPGAVLRRKLCLIKIMCSCVTWLRVLLFNKYTCSLVQQEHMCSYLTGVHVLLLSILHALLFNRNTCIHVEQWMIPVFWKVGQSSDL